MSAATVIRPGTGEVIGDSPDRRVELLADHDALHATWTRFGPGREGADPHVHHRHTDLFYVLAGELTVRLGLEDRLVPVPAETLVRVPPRVVHGFRNAGATGLRYLNLHAPGEGFADYMRGLRDGVRRPFDQAHPPADGVRPASDASIGRAGPVAVSGGVQTTLLADAEAIAIAEVACEPRAEAPAHRHRRHAECLYVLDGELALTAGDDAVRVPAGSWVHVPPDVPHAVAAGGPGTLRLLEIHAPGCGYGAFVRALARPGAELDAAVAGAGFDQERAR